MPVIFTPYLQKVKERLPPTTHNTTDSDTDEDAESAAGPSGRRLVVGATITGIVGVAAVAIARRLRIRRRDGTSTPPSSEGRET